MQKTGANVTTKKEQCLSRNFARKCCKNWAVLTFWHVCNGRRRLNVHKLPKALAGDQYGKRKPGIGPTFLISIVLFVL
jgi:hypothetical protein